MSALSNRSYIAIHDYREYDPCRCCNGGGYAFSTSYKRLAGGNMWLVEQHSSADFCPYCRSWNCSGQCHTADEVISSEELEEIVERAMHTLDEELYLEMC